MFECVHVLPVRTNSVSCVPGPGESGRGDADAGLLPAAREEEEADGDVGGGFLRSMVRTLPGSAAGVEENGSGTKLLFKHIHY